MFSFLTTENENGGDQLKPVDQLRKDSELMVGLRNNGNQTENSRRN